MNLNEQAAAKAAERFPYWNNDMSHRVRVLESRCDYESGYLAGHAAANESKPSEPAGDLVERMLEKLLTMTNFEAAAKACAEIAQQECQNKAVGFAEWSVQSPYARFGTDKWGLGDGTFITTADLYSEYLKTNPAQ